MSLERIRYLEARLAYESHFRPFETPVIDAAINCYEVDCHEFEDTVEWWSAKGKLMKAVEDLINARKRSEPSPTMTSVLMDIKSHGHDPAKPVECPLCGWIPKPRTLADKMLMALDNIELCPNANCGNIGFYSVGQGNPENPNQKQCEFCYTNPNSKFNFRVKLGEVAAKATLWEEGK